MGLPDFHKMAVSVLKMHFPKHKLSVILYLYRDYKSFCKETTELDINLSKYDICNMECQQIFNIFIEVLGKYALKKNKHIKANQSGFINKNLRKVIIRRPRRRNIFIKEKAKK